MRADRAAVVIVMAMAETVDPAVAVAVILALTAAAEVDLHAAALALVLVAEAPDDDTLDQDLDQIRDLDRAILVVDLVPIPPVVAVEAEVVNDEGSNDCLIRRPYQVCSTPWLQHLVQQRYLELVLVRLVQEWI